MPLDVDIGCNPMFSADVRLKDTGVYAVVMAAIVSGKSSLHWDVVADL